MTTRSYVLPAVNFLRLDEELRALSIPGLVGVRFDERADGAYDVHVVLGEDPSQAESDSLDTAASAHSSERTLAEAKKAKIEAVDRRTAAGIDAGHVWDGKTFSLSSNAQRWITGLYVAKTFAAYPVKVNTKHDDETGLLASEDDVTAFYANAVSSVRSWLDTGTALKDQVRASTTVQDVDAIVDGR